MTWSDVGQRLADHQRLVLSANLPALLPRLERRLTAMLDHGAPYGTVMMAGIIAMANRNVLQSNSGNLTTLLGKMNACWLNQGQPSDLASLDLTTLSSLQVLNLRMLLLAAEKVVTGMPAVWNLEDIQKLDPSVFVRALGWQNLRRSVPSELLSFAEQRSDISVGLQAAELRSLLVFLFGQRERWYCPYLVLAAAVLTGERLHGEETNTPLSVRTCIKNLAAFFRRTTMSPGYTTESLDRAIGTMIHIGGVSSNNSSVAEYVNDYVRCVNAERRWMEKHPAEGRSLSHHLLPVPAWPVNVKAQFFNVKRAQRTRRHEQVNAILPFVKPLAHQVMARAGVLRALGDVYLATLKRAEEQGLRAGPVPFELRLADGSATLRFALWRPEDLKLPEWSASRRWDRLPDHWLTEYLGAEHDGEALPAPFFSVLQGAWHDPVSRTALIALGTLKSDLASCPTGLLRPERRRGEFVTALTMAAIKRGDPPKNIFDLPALCAGMSIGTLFFMLAVNTGLRIHELQQIRLDEGYISDPETEFPAEGDFFVALYPKAHKRAKAKLTEYQIDGMHRPLWQDVLTWLDRSEGISDQVRLEFGDLQGLQPGRYLFQFGRRALKQEMLQKLLRFACFGLRVPATNGQTVSLSSHLLRHVNARIQAEQGHSTKRVQGSLGHANPAETEHYLGPVFLRGATGMLGLIEPLTLWQALLPEVRPVRRVQEGNP